MCCVCDLFTQEYTMATAKSLNPPGALSAALGPIGGWPAGPRTARAATTATATTATARAATTATATTTATTAATTTATTSTNKRSRLTDDDGKAAAASSTTTTHKVAFKQQQQQEITNGKTLLRQMFPLQQMVEVNPKAAFNPHSPLTLIDVLPDDSKDGKDFVSATYFQTLKNNQALQKMKGGIHYIQRVVTGPEFDSSSTTAATSAAASANFPIGHQSQRIDWKSAVKKLLQPNTKGPTEWKDFEKFNADDDTVFISNIGRDLVDDNSKLIEFFELVKKEAKQMIDVMDSILETNESAASSSSSSSSKPKDRISWENLMKKCHPIDGFGLNVQAYLKLIFACTPGHSELAWAAALNKMLRDSLGVALWIGFHFTDVQQCLKDKYSLEQMLELLDCKLNGDVYPMKYVIDIFLKAGVKLYYAFQTPGQMVYSPSTVDGAGHFVISIGTNIMQLALNSHQSMAAFKACIETFKEIKHSVINGGQSTRSIVPCLLLQKSHDIGLSKELEELEKFKQSIVKDGTVKVEEHIHESVLCAGTNHITDLYSFNGQCKYCFLNKNHSEKINKKKKPVTSAAAASNDESDSAELEEPKEKKLKR